MSSNAGPRLWSDGGDFWEQALALAGRPATEGGRADVRRPPTTESMFSVAQAAEDGRDVVCIPCLSLGADGKVACCAECPSCIWPAG